MNHWIQSGGLPKDFYDIFNIPYPTYDEITKAISYLSELFDNYSWYIQSISNVAKPMKKEQYLALLLADIFGELGISIKLAGEGYIKYSLREIRSVLDLLFAGLFTVSSWPVGSKKFEDGINPMAEAFFSGLWGRLKSLSIDDLIVSDLGYWEEKDRKSVTRELLSLAQRLYPEIISEFGLEENNINRNQEKRLKSSLEVSLRKFLTDILKETGEWKGIENDSIADSDYFYWLLINNDNYTLKACAKHENKFIGELMKKLGITGEITDEIKQQLSQLTFRLHGFYEDEPPLCTYCENKATVYGILARPDTASMKKLIKLQFDKDELNEINELVNNSFDYVEIEAKGPYFGDIIYSKLYIKLNDYVHSNVVEEPDIQDWLKNFFAPTIIILSCILSRSLGIQDDEK